MKIRRVGFTLQEAYKRYLAKNPKGSKHYLEKKRYLNICYTYNKTISKIMIEEGEQIRLPFRLSTIGIKKYKTNYLNPVFDYHYFNTTGKKAFIINTHSDDYKVYFYWRKDACSAKGKKYYNFNPVRDNSRALAKRMKMKNGHKIYSTRER